MRPPERSIAFQWHTKVKYVVDLPLTYVVGMMVVDKKAYDALAPEDQKALSEEMQKAFDRLDGQIAKDNEAARATLAKQGIQFLAPGPGEVEYWQGIGDESAKRMNADNAFTPEMYQKLVATIAEHRAQRGDDKPK